MQNLYQNIMHNVFQNTMHNLFCNIRVNCFKMVSVNCFISLCITCIKTLCITCFKISRVTCFKILAGSGNPSERTNVSAVIWLGIAEEAINTARTCTRMIELATVTRSLVLAVGSRWTDCTGPVLALP